MKFANRVLAFRHLSIAACSLSLAACGGGGPTQDSTTPTAMSSSGSAEAVTAGRLLTSPLTTTVPVTTTPSTPAPVPATGAVTDVRFQNTSTSVQTNVPVTFGQVFAKGDLQATDVLSGRLEDGTTVPLQVNVKAKHADGSVRHAIISAVVPSIAASQTRTMALVKGGSAPTGAGTIDALMRTGFSASAHAKIGGVDYYAAADDLLKSAKSVTWLSGPVATEWEVDAPLHTAGGAQHPHLTAHFAIRWYPGVNKTRVDVVLENNWAYENAPQNFTYDASVLVGGKSVYSKAGLTHYHHSRWRKMFWADGSEPQVNIKHNTAYLINSRAVPNYDQSVVVPETTLAELQNSWTGAITEPGGVGVANPFMPSTGGRNDIGLLPSWGAEYLLSMDKRAKTVTLGTADQSGSWSSHYRDKQTGLPVSLLDYPYMTILGHTGDAYNPTLKRSEAFPACAGAGLCDTPNTHDSPHQPNLAYLPYLVTGDYYYLEELQFWAMWNVFSDNPGYRQFEKGLVQPDQVRGQAWSLRTLAEAAYITPDDNRLKSQFMQILDSNLDWFNATYTNNPSANKLGIIVNGYSLVYANGRGLAPWQDDFFTSAVGHVAELGFDKAVPLLKWKAKFSVDRMTAPGACWVDGAIYTLYVRDSDTSPFYSTMAEAYKASHTPRLPCTGMRRQRDGERAGRESGRDNWLRECADRLSIQHAAGPCLAADALGTPGKAAWTVFMGRTVKPDYSSNPQFDIVPR